MNYNMSWSNWEKNINQWKFWYSSYQPSVQSRIKQIRLQLTDIERQLVELKDLLKSLESSLEEE